MKKPETRKQEILDGALTVFLKKGYEKTTITDIAQELGISQGLCYRYFGSKEEIYDAVIDLYAAIIAEENLKSRPQNQSIAQWIDSIPDRIRAMTRAEKENPRLYGIFHTSHSEKMHRDLYSKIVQAMLPAVTAVLEQAKARGEIRISNCGQTAAFGLYGAVGLLMTQGADCADGIRENWRMLLEME